MVGAEGAVLLGVRRGVGGFVAAVEGSVVHEAECHRVDLPVFQVDDCDTQPAVGVRVDGSGEVNPQTQRRARHGGGVVGVAHDGVLVERKAQLGEELGSLQEHEGLRSELSGVSGVGRAGHVGWWCSNAERWPREARPGGGTLRPAGRRAGWASAERAGGSGKSGRGP